MSRSLSSEQEIVASLRKIIRAVDLYSRRLVEAFGMTGPQLATLQEVARLGPTSASSIARAVHLSQGTVTGILARLEARGMVTRQRSDTDRRSIIVSVTPAGEQLLGTAPSLLQDRFRRELESLEQWERSQILATLQRVAALMGAEDLDAAPHLISDTVNLQAGGTMAATDGSTVVSDGRE
ncbi:MAG: MarR family transcriptional regulator [Phycisphaerae bacterium]|nr:MarR family transcriptional regulator [Phycisphaerae bacterium]